MMQLTPSQQSLIEAHKARRARIAARAIPEPKPTPVPAMVAPEPVNDAQPVIVTAEEQFRRAWEMLGHTMPSRLVDRIQRETARHYNVTKREIFSRRRTAKVVKPRQVAMFLAKELTLRSLPELGRLFGGRDHTTVLHAVRKIEAQIQVDADLRSDIEVIKQSLGAPHE